MSTMESINNNNKKVRRILFYISRFSCGAGELNKCYLCFIMDVPWNPRKVK